ncbi:MAG: hypothetical protein J0M02_00220 [Planctomycetes bacterium]|nr:hypothetical protein [Planctomycetota bacterium]
MSPVATILLTASCIGAAVAGESPTSRLWGAEGEGWSASSRLPGFAWSGYRSGRLPLPEYPVVTDVRRHGAIGDGTTDDTQAFKAAIASVGELGAVLVPAGRYMITDVLTIDRSRVVLRGEGSDRTTLVMPKPLSAIRPLGNVDGTKSAYSFTGGFVVLTGGERGRKVADVIAPALRGARTLDVGPDAAVKPGDWVRLVMQDPEDHSLLRHIHGDLVEPGEDTLRHKKPVNWAAQIVEVEGGRIRLDRPLRVDVRMEWLPVLHAHAPVTEDSGVEGLHFEFPGVPKLPHLLEEGYNAIHLNGVSNCWVKDVLVTDADNGVIVGGSRFCTIEAVTARANRRTTEFTGHHFLWATVSQDCLFTGFKVDTVYVHDLTVEGFASGNVFTRGSGVSINCDHHRNGPYENLFTDIDVGDASRLYRSSGSANRGPHSGARTTFWGLRGRGAFQALPVTDHFPLLNVVGFGGYADQTESANGPWVEGGSAGVRPVNLWIAQVRKLGQSEVR